MKSYLAKDPGQKRGWVLVDAKDKVLGRLAVQIANLLRGKNKPTYTPCVDTGEFVVVINAEKVRLTGKKEEQKTYHRYSGWPGGLKTIPVADMRRKHPEQIVRLAVKGMLPRNKLCRTVFRRLKVYAGENHPHAAQNPLPASLS